MNREQQERAKWALPFVKAIAEGKVVQYKDVAGKWHDWKDITLPVFGLAQDRYRIKPDPPIEKWFKVYDDGSFSSGFSSRESLDFFFQKSRHIGRVICMREVRE